MDSHAAIQPVPSSDSQRDHRLLQALLTRGIDVDGAANIIIRNTCSGNGVNWTIAAFNVVAPIIAAFSNQAAINGNSCSGSLGSTDPNANFTH